MCDNRISMLQAMIYEVSITKRGDDSPFWLKPL